MCMHVCIERFRNPKKLWNFQIQGIVQDQFNWHLMIKTNIWLVQDFKTLQSDRNVFVFVF